MRKNRTLVCLLAALALTLTACSQHDDAPDVTSTALAHRGDTFTFTSATDYSVALVADQSLRKPSMPPT